MVGKFLRNFSKHWKVNGRSDLTDFFPVWLRLESALDAYPPGGDIEYRLRQADGALRFVYTDLVATNAGNYLITDAASYGSSFTKNAYEADTIAIPDVVGVPLSSDFLSRIASDPNKGVILVEAAKPAFFPLVLEVWTNDVKVLETPLRLSILGVQNMYRWINLRHVTSGKEKRITRTVSPLNYPDNISNGKQVVFVHGFNVDEKKAEAWGSEIFKRLYQSGSRAMYTAVTWQGDEDPLIGLMPAAAYYHLDVINAFQVASALVSEVTDLPGQKYVAAHSLGNMVVSSAIRDHGFNPARYFMIDAAVAMEAYKSSAYEPLDIAEPPWPSYTNRLWASEWYKLFDESDGRHDFTWRGRFGNIPQAVNYYSSGEDVLKNNEKHESMLITGVERSWIYQEKIKGRLQTTILRRVTSHGGWGFNNDYNVFNLITMPADQAALITTNQLRANSFFKRFYEDGLYGSDGSTVASIPYVRAKVLAEAIPATSRATGRNEVGGYFGDNNIDLMKKMKNGWPLKRITQDDPDGRWFHSDSKNVAYPYVYKFFDDMVYKLNED